MDGTELREAYDDLLVVALAGRFAGPGPGSWTAEALLAHVVLADRLVREVTETLLQRSAVSRALRRGLPVYDDAETADEARLRRLARSSGGLGELVGLVSFSAEETVALVEQLTEAQAGARVRVRVTDGDAVVVDEVRPWQQQLSTYATGRLPQHTAELRALQAPRG